MSAYTPPVTETALLAFMPVSSLKNSRLGQSGARADANMKSVKSVNVETTIMRRP